jgi:hypothetical protein
LSGQRRHVAWGVEGGVCVDPSFWEECVCGATKDALTQRGGIGGGEGPYRGERERRGREKVREKGEGWMWEREKEGSRGLIRGYTTCSSKLICETSTDKEADSR